MEIELTENALNKIKKENITKIMFSLTKYGCSGYAFILNEMEEKEKDNVVGVKNVSGITIGYNKYTEEKLKGSKTIIDYTVGDFASLFTFKNSKAKESCGCGDSVYLEGEDE